MRFLILPFILLPILEMVVLIKVGSAIGAWNTVSLVILGGFAGLAVIRRQGVSASLKARQKLAAGELPAFEMIETLMIAVGGLLLLIPGFISDFMGMSLLISPVRKALIRKVASSGPWQVQQTEIYEGKFRRESGWGRHHTHISHTYEGDFSRDSAPTPPWEREDKQE
ncbi:MAG: FxsA family protein [Endozoicomonas sp.]